MAVAAVAATWLMYIPAIAAGCAWAAVRDRGSSRGRLRRVVVALLMVLPGYAAGTLVALAPVALALRQPPAVPGSGPLLFWVALSGWAMVATWVLARPALGRASAHALLAGTLAPAALAAAEALGAPAAVSVPLGLALLCLCAGATLSVWVRRLPHRPG